MKKVVISLLLLLLCFTVLFAEEDENKTQTAVIFKDRYLEREVRKAIGRLEGSLFKSDLAGITELVITNRDITDLSGLEYCVNLTHFAVEGDHFDYVEAIKWRISDRLARSSIERGIKDLSPLAELHNLKSLHILNSRIVDLTPLKGLVNLTELNLRGNLIEDISPLAGLENLKVLGLRKNLISDLSPLAGLTNLRELLLLYNRIEDISPLKRLARLKYLDLAHNEIKDLDPIKGFSHTLIGLWVEYNNMVIKEDDGGPGAINYEVMKQFSEYYFNWEDGNIVAQYKRYRAINLFPRRGVHIRLIEY